MPQATISRPLKRNRTKTPKMSWGFKNHFDGLCAFDRPFKFHIILATGNYATVIIAEHRNRFTDQIRAKDALARDVEIVAVNDGEKRRHHRA